jgi:4-hydroxy-tetrahydrodipicolinate synthase
MPTPLLPDLELDLESLARSIEWQHGLSIEGLFVAGTCGEGPFLRDRQIDLLTRSTVELSAGRMPVSVQVTDNSAGRILDRIARAKDHGAQMATLAPPRFERFATPNTLGRLYREVLDRTPLPLCIYNLPFKTMVPLELVPELYAHPNLRMVKDSTADIGTSVASGVGDCASRVGPRESTLKPQDTAPSRRLPAQSSATPARRT